MSQLNRTNIKTNFHFQMEEILRKIKSLVQYYKQETTLREPSSTVGLGKSVGDSGKFEKDHEAKQDIFKVGSIQRGRNSEEDKSCLNDGVVHHSRMMGSPTNRFKAERGSRGTSPDRASGDLSMKRFKRSLPATLQTVDANVQTVDFSIPIAADMQYSEGKGLQVWGKLKEHDSHPPIPFRP